MRIIGMAAVTAGAMGATAAGNFLETHSVDLKTVAAVGGVVLPATWWLARKFTQIEDRFDAGSKRFDALERKIDRLQSARRGKGQPE
jgi:hypothetical protein